ncbi:MAG: carbohydrate kinase family protein [Brevinematales bacterium]
MPDIVCLGEILVDMTSQQGPAGTLYEPNPGGAPANVAVAVSRLGGKAGFIGSVGKDFFGDLLRHTLEANGVDMRCLRATPSAPTTLAFVHLDGRGERSFSFYRSPGADLFLQWGVEEKALMDSCRIFHFGSLSMTRSSSKRMTKKALSYARKRGKIVSFDPNLRPSLWKSLREARNTILSVVKKVHIFKMSEEELLFLSGYTDFSKGLTWARELGLPLVVITRGSEGVVCLYHGAMLSTGSYRVEVVDTTGAGDAFVGGFLFRLVQETDIFSLSNERMLSHLQYASVVAALTVSRRGAIPALPFKEEVERFLESYQPQTTV